MTIKDTIQNLEERIARASHKPGQWHICKVEGQAVCAGCSQAEAKLTGMRQLLNMDPHDFIGRGLDKGDRELAVAAVNSLPELLELAKDGLKYRASIEQG